MRTYGERDEIPDTGRVSARLPIGSGRACHSGALVVCTEESSWSGPESSCSPPERCSQHCSPPRRWPPRPRRPARRRWPQPRWPRRRRRRPSPRPWASSCRARRRRRRSRLRSPTRSRPTSRCATRSTAPQACRSWSSTERSRVTRPARSPTRSSSAATSRSRHRTTGCRPSPHRPSRPTTRTSSTSTTSGTAPGPGVATACALRRSGRPRAAAATPSSPCSTPASWRTMPTSRGSWSPATTW